MTAVRQRRGFAAILAVGALACAAPDPARGQASPSSAAPSAAATNAASAPSSAAASGAEGKAQAAGADTFEMVSPDGSRKQVVRNSVPESVGWGTDAEGRRVPVTRVELTDGPVREVRRYGPGGAFLDVTRAALPPPPAQPDPPVPPVP